MILGHFLLSHNSTQVTSGWPQFLSANITGRLMRVRRIGKYSAYMVGVAFAFSHCRIPVQQPTHNSQRVHSNVGNREIVCLRVLKTYLMIKIDLQIPITLSTKPYVADLSWCDSERKNRMVLRWLLSKSDLINKISWGIVSANFSSEDERKELCYFFF